MKKSDVIGRRIVSVQQEKFWNAHTDTWCVALHAFVLDNGAIISFSTAETGSDYATVATVRKYKATEEPKKDEQKPEGAV